MTSGSPYCPSNQGDHLESSDSDYENHKAVYHNMERLLKAKRSVFSKKQHDMGQDIISRVKNCTEKTDKLEGIESGNTSNVHITAEGITISAKKKKIFEMIPKTSKKRTRNPQNWKRKRAAISRQKGEEYISQNGKVVKKKVANEGNLCKENCRRKCNLQFSIEDRELILRKYYSLDVNAKNTLIFKSIQIEPVSRHRPQRCSSKVHTFKYFITHQTQLRQVCRDAFCSLYRIGRKKVEITQNLLKRGIPAPSPDMRGRHKSRPHKVADDVVNCIINHIKDIPAEESHYSRNKNHNRKYLSPLLNINRLHQLYMEQCKERKLDEKFMVKVSFYRHIFETKFNLSFGHPKSDTCSTCDSGQKSSEHEENYRFAFHIQKLNRQDAATDKTKCYITMDLQQTMPLPKLSTSKAFYLRQMWFYNFGIHCVTHLGHKSYFFNWTEDVANRGSNEIGSCLLRFCKLIKTEQPQIQHLIIWSDSCGGQNKNFYMLCLHEYLILKKLFRTVDHKFPEVGHSYLDSDRDFGRIEKELRKHQMIFIPDQYEKIITSASTKNSLCYNMKHFFYNLEELPAILRLYKRVNNVANDKVNLRDGVKWIRVDKFGYYHYKTNLDPYMPFLLVDLHKKGTKEVLPKQITLTALPKCGGLTVEKLSNLREQLKFVDEDYRWFYEEIFLQNIENPKKKRKTF